ncbi:hypothetical protein H6P81_000660 [Aristolochia fimbriata]|uniref:L-gulonolactone oxidase n=1 Tax=Aristolochia fimbriata TaxID=158543 RepID=A0AAV7F8R0_ARIFI|nr:hypothetical protein H6P81_000660 [Aristolochia fimbriata]
MGLRLVQGLLLLFLLCFSEFAGTHGRPPRPPVKCDGSRCTVSNAYGVWGDRKDCLVSAVLYPETEEELRLAVAQAKQKKQKVKVVSGFSHTIPKLICPGSPPETSVVISTAKYNKNISVDVKNLRVTADSGVGLRDLIDRVEEAGLSLVPSPYWEGVSLGGLISTGSHGSSWWGKGGSVHDHLVGISLVVVAGASEGYAKIIRLESNDPLFNAARVSLGHLAVISKVTFSLEPGFKRSITNIFKNDAELENEFLDHAQRHEFADITWYPSQKTAVFRNDDRVPLNTSGDGINDFLGFQLTPTIASIGIRASEKSMESRKDFKGKCTLAATETGYKKLVGNGLKNNKVLFTGYPVVGRQGKMQTSGSCLHSSEINLLSMCAWDPRIKGLFFYESTAIFPAPKFRDFIVDVKKLRDLQPENFCGLDIYNGFLIRFIKASGAYLGQSEDSVAVDFNYYRAEDALTPRLAQDVWEEVEQMAFFKYRAKPHWAKNRIVAFIGVEEKYPNFGKFLEARKQLDPQGMFSSEISDEVLLGLGFRTKSDGCAMEGQCICSEDRHCNPDKGYLCRPGLVYKEARVCRDSSVSTF